MDMELNVFVHFVFLIRHVGQFENWVIKSGGEGGMFLPFHIVPWVVFPFVLAGIIFSLPTNF